MLATLWNRERSLSLCSLGHLQCAHTKAEVSAGHRVLLQKQTKETHTKKTDLKADKRNPFKPAVILNYYIYNYISLLHIRILFHNTFCTIKVYIIHNAYTIITILVFNIISKGKK